MLQILAGGLILAKLAAGQVTCGGRDIPQADALRGQYPPVLTPAAILPSDTLARSIYNAILATNSPLLAIAPKVLAAGVATIIPGDPDCHWTATRCSSSKHAGLAPDIATCNEPHTLGTSLDDGPTCYHGPLYTMLAQRRQTVSLYYIGSNVLTWPIEAQLGFTGGHEICAHTWSHQYLTTLTNEVLFAEMYYSKKIIKQVIGVSTRCMRSPYGDTDDRVRFFAQALDMRLHAWDADTADWSAATLGNATVQANYQRIRDADHSRGGTIVLSHESNPTVVGLAMSEYPKMVEAFRYVTPVGTCTNTTRLYAESRYPDNIVHAQYVTGQRTRPVNSAFWSTEPVLYLNSTAAVVGGATSSSLPSSSSSSSSLGNPSGPLSSVNRGSPTGIALSSQRPAQNAQNSNTSGASVLVHFTFATLLTTCLIAFHLTS